MSADALTATVADGRLAETWVGNVDLQSIVDGVGTPVFVYSAEQLRRNIRRVKDAAASAGLEDRVELYVPFFPNANPYVLKPLREAGVGLLLQLPGEYKILRRFGFDRFIVSPGHVSNAEIDFWSGTGYPTFLASLDEVAHALRTQVPSISVRIDSLGSGKPGIKLGELDRLTSILAKYGRELLCFEVYCGSGNSRDEMVAVIDVMFEIFTEHFPTAKSVNFAGGHGFDYEKWSEAEKHFDWESYFQSLRRAAERMGVPGHVKFLFEPARDVLADTGVLLLSVERDVITTPVSSIVVTDGSRMLMPSAQLRDRRHHVAFLDGSLKETAPDSAADGIMAAVRGRSILRHDYILPGEYLVPRGVDAESYMLIMDVGAYCATQHMEFLNIPPAAEVLLDADGVPQLITAHGDELDRWRYLLPEQQALQRRA